MRNIVTKPVRTEKVINCPYCGGHKRIVYIKSDGKVEDINCGYCRADGKIVTKGA